MSVKFQLKSNIPENLGIPSDKILNYIEHLERHRLCLHSFMILRHGEIAAEGYYPPFTANRNHRMYSTSKTYVAIAIGMLADEGKIKLNDKIIDYFPEHLPANVNPYLADATIRDLLMMSTPYTYGTYGRDDKDWVWTFLNREPSHPGGTIFQYDTSGTVYLNGIVEKVSGTNLLDYMRPKLLDKIGFSKDAWCVERPEGGSWGGSGVECSTHDMAKFALLLLNKGRWNGEQLVSEAFMNEATSALIDNRISTSDPELQFGYGYQIWRTRNNGYATVGMGSQMSVCVPDKDLVFLTTGDTQIIGYGNNLILDTFWTEVYPYISDEKLPENNCAYEKLSNKLKNLKFLPVEGNLTSNKLNLYNGKKYILNPNPMKISEITFNFNGEKASMDYINATGAHTINFGIGDYVYGEFPENHYFGRKIGVKQTKGYDYKASGAWFNDDNLMIYLYVIDDYFGTLKISVSFKDKQISMMMNKVAEWFLDEYQGFAAGYLAE